MGNMHYHPGSNMNIHSSGTYVMAVKIYNTLSECLKSEENDNIFISKLKQLLIETTFYTLDEFLKDKFTVN